MLSFDHLHLSLFETGMLLCFGASWPFALYKTWKTKITAGKSLTFLWLVLIGYLCGLTHKILYSPDLVIVLYALNTLMVVSDLTLTYCYHPRQSPAS